MWTKTQTIQGITSQVSFDHHIVLWDFDNKPLEECIDSLTYVQKKYGLGEIAILSDKIGHYRAICWTIVNLETLLRILIDTRGVDIGHIKYTAMRSKASLRLTPKQGRPPTGIVHIIKGRHDPIPEALTSVTYDTGFSRGLTIGSKQE